MNHCAQYIARAKTKFGNPRMSDRELGERLGYVQQNIARAKSGYMTDPIAIAIAKHLGDDPAEIVIVARAEREKDQALRLGMLRIVGKLLASVPAKAAGALCALAVALGLMLSPAPDTQASGGKGGIRTLGTA